MFPGFDSVANINIYIKETKVASLHFNIEGHCKLRYEVNWKLTGFPLSPALPFNEQFESSAIINFLKNLFPEGEAFNALLDLNRISKENIYAIISAIGHDTSGALVFANEPPSTTFENLRKITEQELVTRLNSYNTRDLILWDDKYRLSVAGVQNKLNILQTKNGDMFLADGKYASTHILKFASKETPLITVNEYFCMKLAKLVELPVAEVNLKKIGSHNILIVHRFDRMNVKNTIRKAHLVDGCQVLNLPPQFKYEQNFGSGRDVKHIRDGVSLRKLFDFTDQCYIPGQEKQFILDWLIFNIFIGNSDAHGKNISFFVGKNLYKLAPFYDLLSVVFEANNNNLFETGLAMAIGENFDINNVKAYDFICLAEEVGIPFKQLKNRLFRMYEKILSSLSKIDKCCKTEDDEVNKVFKLLKNLIEGRCSQLFVELEQLDFVKKSAF